jgi:hypothetical protein
MFKYNNIDLIFVLFFIIDGYYILNVFIIKKILKFKQSKSYIKINLNFKHIKFKCKGYCSYITCKTFFYKYHILTFA